MGYIPLHNLLQGPVITKADFPDFAGYYKAVKKLAETGYQAIGIRYGLRDLYGFMRYDFSCLAHGAQILVKTDEGDCPNGQNPSYYYGNDTKYGEFFEVKYSTSYKHWYIEQLSDFDIPNYKNIEFNNIGIGKNHSDGYYNIDIDGDNMANGLDGLGRGTVYVGNSADGVIAYINGKTITTKLKVVIHGNSNNWFIGGGSYDAAMPNPPPLIRK